MCMRRLKKLRTPGFNVKVIDHQLQNTKHLTAPLLQISQLHKLSAKVEGRSFAWEQESLFDLIVVSTANIHTFKGHLNF